MTGFDRYRERAYERGFQAGVESASVPVASLKARIATLEHDLEFFKIMFMRAYEQLMGEEAPRMGPKANDKKTDPPHPKQHNDGGADE